MGVQPQKPKILGTAACVQIVHLSFNSFVFYLFFGVLFNFIQHDFNISMQVHCNIKEFHRTHGKQGARQIILDNPKNKLSAHLSPSSKI